MELFKKTKTMENKNLFQKILIGTAGVILLNACSNIPKGATAIKPFDKAKYLGKWFEIARMDFRFERNLNNTTAEYSLNDNGTIRVVNRGYNYVTKEWKQAVGKAKFDGNPTEAKLKVSFFGPFYSGYNVIALDNDYKYALVAGKNLKYLWILSREITIPEDTKQDFLKVAEAIGYSTTELIWVEHDKK
jgi:apolipoprotein D and lipocalin family protein